MRKCIDCINSENLRRLADGHGYSYWRLSCGLGSKNHYLPESYEKRALHYNQRACRLFKSKVYECEVNAWGWH